MDVKELKELIKVNKDVELATKLDRSISCISNWRKDGKVPDKIVAKAHALVNAIQGHNNTIVTNQELPEINVIKNIITAWDDKKRKMLLKYVLELDME